MDVERGRSRVFPTGFHLRSSAFICGLIVATGCGGYAGPRSIVNEDPAVKIPQIKNAVATNDRAALKQFVKDLDSDDSAVRFYSIEGLRRMTHESFGYDWTTNDRFERAASIARWKQYVDATEPAAR